MNSEQLVSCGSLSKIPNWEGRKTNNQIRRNWVFGTGSLRVDWAVRQTLRNGSDLSQAAQTQAEGGRKHQWVNVCAPSSGAACRWRGARRGYGALRGFQVADALKTREVITPWAPERDEQQEKARRRELSHGEQCWCWSWARGGGGPRWHRAGLVPSPTPPTKSGQSIPEVFDITVCNIQWIILCIYT